MNDWDYAELQIDHNEAIEALEYVQFGSCDGCGRGGFCYWCSNHPDFNFEEETHLPKCPVGKVLAKANA